MSIHWALCGFVVAVALLVGSVHATETESAERLFVVEAHRRNIGEIELAHLVPGHTTTKSVREFAQRIIDDHTALDRTVRRIALDQAITLTADPTPEFRAARAELSQLRGVEFDRLYVRRALEEHRATIERFENQARTGRDPTIREFAHTASARLREHLALAHHLASAPHDVASEMGSGHCLNHLKPA